MTSRTFGIIGTADVIALNRYQDLSCSNPDLSSLEHVGENNSVFVLIQYDFGEEKRQKNIHHILPKTTNSEIQTS